MNKNFSIFAAILLVVSLLAGCGNSLPGSENALPASDESVDAAANGSFDAAANVEDGGSAADETGGVQSSTDLYSKADISSSDGFTGNETPPHVKDYGEETENSERNQESAKAHIQYIAENGDQSSTERLEIFLPAEAGYIRYEFNHCVDDERNSDIWHIGKTFAVNDDFEEIIGTTIDGEWECALHLKGRDDFSGGIAHGDEVMQDISVFVDGKQTDMSSLSQMRECDTIKIIQTSLLYDPLDGTRVIAKHYSEHVFDDRVTIDQSITWQVAEPLIACYLAMFPASKMVTNKVYTERDNEVTELDTDDYEKTFPNEKSCTLFSDDSGFSATFAIEEYPADLDPNANYLLVTDNGGLAYNKCYYVLVSNESQKSSAVGEEWHTRTVYTLKYKGKGNRSE